MNVRATEDLLYILLETRIGNLNDLVSSHCISDLLHYSKGIFMLNARVLKRIFMTKGILFPHKCPVLSNSKKQILEFHCCFYVLE